MLELSMTLPIKVQNGGLFISRGVGRHPARRLESWEIIFVEKGRLAIQEEERIFLVDAGESLLLWPNRQHVGVEDFPADLKFYWLHFEVKAPDSDPRWLTHLSVPQQTKVADPQALVALFRQFLSEQEKHQRTPALLARELYCNADYLGRVYRRVFHLTLTEAIHRHRVREAEKLLISEARSLTEVAALCGFNDVGYFRQIFRKHTGLTPAAWKRRYSKEHINS
ncbi:AraC family transcriptional regulator [Escherichia coli]|nr:AraC family transcriptional regulator [Escherichia coli]